MKYKITKLNASEIKTLITYVIKNNVLLQTRGLNPTAISIVGEAGLGKTTIVKQLGEEVNKEVIKINLAQIEELGDIVGFPIKEFQVCKQDGSDCKWVNEHGIESYLKDGYKLTELSRMGYAKPAWIADKTEGVILLLDDWTRADTRFLNAVMDLINEQKYISWEMPKGSTIILTENPDNGEYLVNSIDNAIRTRFTNVEMVFDVKEWAKYAEETGIDGRCINFMLVTPEIIRGKGINPRALTNFFNTISSIQDFNTAEGLSMINMIGEGSIGDAATGLFVAFINNKLDKLPTPEEIMTCSTERLEKLIEESVGKTNLNTYRADIASTLCTRTTNYMVNYAKSNTIDKKLVDRLEELCLKQHFGSDLALYMIKTLYASNQKKFAGLTLRDKLAKHILS